MGRYLPLSVGESFLQSAVTLAFLKALGKVAVLILVLYVSNRLGKIAGIAAFSI